MKIRVQALFQKLLHARHVARVDVFEELLAVFLRVDLLKFFLVLEVKMTKYSSLISKLYQGKNKIPPKYYNDVIETIFETIGRLSKYKSKT